jgi:hypothetical protein
MTKEEVQKGLAEVTQLILALSANGVLNEDAAAKAVDCAYRIGRIQRNFEVIQSMTKGTE